MHRVTAPMLSLLLSLTTALGCAGASSPPATAATSASSETSGTAESDDLGRARGTSEHECELRRQRECSGCRWIDDGSGPTAPAEASEDTSFSDDVELGPARPHEAAGRCSTAASGAELGCASFCCTGCMRE